MPDDPEAVARVVAQTGRPRYPELPTAVGFCMLVTRAALNEVGVFDEGTLAWATVRKTTFAAGPSQLGLLTCFVTMPYVVHVGGASFGPLGLRPGGEAMSRLVARHPDYPDVIQAFIRDDPFRARREAIVASLPAAIVPESPPMADSTPALPFDGERFTPECVREMWYEHWHRYVFAQDFVAGKRVLDLACGEGYGADLLARTASSVVGVDISEAAIAHARARYDRPGLSLRLATVRPYRQTMARSTSWSLSKR